MSCAFYLTTGASFITKFISLAQFVPARVALQVAESWPKTPIISFNCLDLARSPHMHKQEQIIQEMMKHKKMEALTFFIVAKSA